MQQSEKERPTVLAQTAYLSTLGLLFVVPVIIGAYLGRWLDGFVEGYSLRWTLSLIMVGVGVGAMNVYLFIKEKA
jgi:ATP synthase protein I